MGLKAFVCVSEGRSGPPPAYEALFFPLLFLFSRPVDPLWTDDPDPRPQFPAPMSYPSSFHYCGCCFPPFLSLFSFFFLLQSSERRARFFSGCQRNKLYPASAILSPSPSSFHPLPFFGSPLRLKIFLEPADYPHAFFHTFSSFHVKH